MRKFRLNLWPTFGGATKLSSANDGDKTEEHDPVVVDGVVLNGAAQQGAGGKFYGIKSYLNSFYHTPTVVEEIENGKTQEGTTWYLLPPPPAQRMGLYVCRLLTVIGLLMLLGGAMAIIVGYCWPRQQNIEGELMKIAIDQDEEGNFYVLPERLTEILADPMHSWKITGFCVFAAGASLMALSLLVPMLAQCCGGTRMAAFTSGDNSPNEPPIRVYPCGAGPTGSRFRVVPAKFTGSHKISPTNAGPVPVMEEIAKVQPGSKNASKAVSPSIDEQLLLDQLVDSTDAKPLIR
ncbi:hypothetical protein niasHS_008856 [Heterodera schachtii]|uniref:Uncharacterized protein n=1 Tax=Heterodera schachtii TaxID=97005 RepID=A0ABD2IVN1_HETSC